MDMLYSLPALHTLIIAVGEDREDLPADQVAAILDLFFSKCLRLERLCIAFDKNCDIWCRSRDDRNLTGWSEVSRVRVNDPRGRFHYLETIDPRVETGLVVKKSFFG